jgi:UDP-3-O-acyl-N-acetylglucosamine deacetylase
MTSFIGFINDPFTMILNDKKYLLYTCLQSWILYEQMDKFMPFYPIDDLFITFLIDFSQRKSPFFMKTLFLFEELFF